MSHDLSELAGPEAPGIVASIGVRLWGDVLAADGLVDALLDTDVALDADGHPVVRPGVRDAVDPRDPHVAPEVRAGEPPTPDAALWGLGAVLYRLATGQPPRLPLAGPPIPPRARTLRPDLPPALDEALALLLDPDPARRRHALPLLEPLQTPLPDLRSLAPGLSASPSRSLSSHPRTPRTREIKVTASGGDSGGGRALDAPVRGMLVLPAADVTPSDVSAIAGALQVPVRRVKELVDSGVDIPVQAGLRGGELADAALASPLPVGPATAPGPALPVLAGAGALVGGGLVTLGAGLVVLSLIATLALVGIGGLVLLGTFAPLVLWIGRYLAWRRTAATWKDLRRIGEESVAHPLVGGARARIARLRTHLATTDHLPDAAAMDVRDGLAEIEDDLDALASAWDVLRAGDDASEAHLRAQTGQVEEGLDAVDAVLQGLGEPIAVGGALERVLQSAELAARSVDSVDDRQRRARAKEQPS